MLCAPAWEAATDSRRAFQEYIVWNLSEEFIEKELLS